MVKTRPLISVIIPLFNTEKYIEECVDSVCKQSYKNLEIIIVDDGSTDRSKEICERCAVSDNRVIIISQKNSGVAMARQCGINASQGEYICFVDSDDTIAHDMVENMYKSIIENDTDASVQVKCSIFPNNNYSRKMKADECIRPLCLLRLPVSMCAYLYSASLVKLVTINPEIHFFEDFLFNYMFLFKANSISAVDKLYYNYRANPQGANHSSLSSKKLSCLNIYDLICEDARRNKHIAELQFFRSHCLIAMIIAAAKLDKRPKDICAKLRGEARKISKDISGNKNVPLKYKVIIRLTAYVTKLTLFVAHFVYILKR